MPGIPEPPRNELKRVLADCAEFRNPELLDSVFADTPELRPWRNRLPNASNPQARVTQVVGFLADEYRVTGDNVLRADL